MAKIVVFPCCAKKKPQYWLHKGQKVEFVANPDKCAKLSGFLYCHPDDRNPHTGKTWRAELDDYNKQYQHNGKNPRYLCEAYKLYEPKQHKKIYQQLYSNFKERLFILSAGWGLVRADFLLPYYDITFSSSAPVCKRRKESDEYHDFNQLADEKLEENDSIYFFGLKDYLSLYCCLTRDLLCKKVIYHRSTRIRICQAEGYEYIQYRREGIAIEKWHYKCAEDFMEGKLQE